MSNIKMEDKVCGKEGFEVWAKRMGYADEFDVPLMKYAANEGWNARQPEIDALQAENKRLWSEINKWKGAIEFECGAVNVPFDETSPDNSLMRLCSHYEAMEQEQQETLQNNGLRKVAEDVLFVIDVWIKNGAIANGLISTEKRLVENLRSALNKTPSQQSDSQAHNV